MWLLIDDVRNIAKADVIARTAAAGYRLLNDMKWDGVMMDHQLGGRVTGAEILEMSLLKKIVPPKVQIVTSDMDGLKRMQNMLLKYGYKEINPREFHLDETPLVNPEGVGNEPVSAK